MKMIIIGFVLLVSHYISAAPVESNNNDFCGVPDTASSGLFHNYEMKWSKSKLTWRIETYPWKNEISESTTRQILREAFQAWTDYIPIEITEVCSSCNADIVVKFVQREHANCASFDGPGGALAHARFPESGIIHFDFDEVWTEDLDGQDTSLYLVAVHEIGHALGLPHDNNRASIMFKNYPPASRSKGLPSLDIASIQNMYGSKRRSTTRVYKLINVGSGKALDIDRSLKDDETNVQIFRDHGGVNQRWAVYTNGDDAVKFINPHSGKALDVYGNKFEDGTNVQLFADNGAGAQRWTWESVGNGNYKIIHKDSGKVLDVAWGGKEDGTNVRIWTDNGTPAQQWYFSFVD